jgi:hypothetical protein
MNKINGGMKHPPQIYQDQIEAEHHRIEAEFRELKELRERVREAEATAAKRLSRRGKRKPSN